MNTYICVIRYLIAHGHCQPKRKHFGKKENEQKKLAYWVERQRSNWKTGTLSEARKKRLDELGFIWPKKGKKRRSPNDKEEEIPAKPIGKTRLEEGRKKLEGDKIVFDAQRKEIDEERSKLQEEWRQLKEEKSKAEKEKAAFHEQLKKDYEKKTWELLEKWKDEWRRMETTKRNEPVHAKANENQKRKGVATDWTASAASASGTPLKKRRLGDEGREKEGADEEDKGEDTNHNTPLGGGGGGELQIDEEREVAEVQQEGGGTKVPTSTLTTTTTSMQTPHLPVMTSTTNPHSSTTVTAPSGHLGDFALSTNAIMQRLDELLAGQKTILAAINGTRGNNT